MDLVTCGILMFGYANLWIYASNGCKLGQHVRMRGFLSFMVNCWKSVAIVFMEDGEN